MRIIALILIAIMYSCSTHKKTVVKKDIIANPIIKEAVIVPKVIFPECLELINRVKNNLHFEFDYDCNTCPEKLDSARRFIYFPWEMDSTINIANSNCWIGLTSKDVIVILGKVQPHVSGAKINMINDHFEYWLTYSRRTRHYSSHIWRFVIKNGVVISSTLEKEVRIPIDK